MTQIPPPPSTLSDADLEAVSGGHLHLRKPVFPHRPFHPVVHHGPHGELSITGEWSGHVVLSVSRFPKP